jgi:hypothetical protein
VGKAEGLDVVTLLLTGAGADGPATEWAADDAAERGIPLMVVGEGQAGDGVTNALARARRRGTSVVAVQQADRETAARPAVVVAGLPSSASITDTLVAGLLRRAGEQVRAPVVIVRGLPGDPGGPVVAGVDPRRVGGVLEFAFAHADRHGLALRVVHAGVPRRRLNLFRVEHSLDVGGPAEEIAVGRLAEALATRYPRVHVDVREGRRRPLEALAREAGGAGLLVIGTPARTARTSRQLGPVGRALAAVPVVAVVGPGRARTA